MRKNQWYVLGAAFLLLTIFFIWQDLNAEMVCGTPTTLDSTKSLEPLLRYELWCINTEIFDPFIYIFIVMGIVCWINGWLEGRAEKEKEQEKLRDLGEKGFVMETADVIGLEHLPRNIPELVFWGKREGKEKEVDEALKTWHEAGYRALISVLEGAKREVDKSTQEIDKDN